jgi:hypothetical protein
MNERSDLAWHRMATYAIITGSFQILLGLGVFLYYVWTGAVSLAFPYTYGEYRLSMADGERHKSRIVATCHPGWHSLHFFYNHCYWRIYKSVENVGTEKPKLNVGKGQLA